MTFPLKALTRLLALALIESQDTVERTDVPPKDRARALRRLTQIDSTVNASDRTPGHGRGRGRPA